MVGIFFDLFFKGIIFLVNVQIVIFQVIIGYYNVNKFILIDIGCIEFQFIGKVVDDFCLQINFSELIIVIFVQFVLIQVICIFFVC